MQKIWESNPMKLKQSKKEKNALVPKKLECPTLSNGATALSTATFSITTPTIAFT
jgi:hypothetical protein